MEPTPLTSEYSAPLPESNVPASLRAFMTQLIDYAGLFPPASLPLDQAFANYACYRRAPDQWMLGRFIIPASRVAALSAIADGMFREAASDNHPFAFSVLGTGGTTIEAFKSALQADVEAIEQFRTQHVDGVSVEVFEVRLPIMDAGEDVIDLITHTDRVFAAHPLALSVYYEVPPQTGVFAEDAQWERRFETLTEAIALSGIVRTGAKLRCGGTTPDAFPSSAQISSALLACKAQWVSLKATAGLHHPLRHFNTEVGAKMHGFLNVFGAGLMAYLHEFNHDQLVEMLEDEESSHFRFNDEGFAWQSHRVTPDEIEMSRSTVLTSYGSCSFDEPRDDLRALCLLP